MSRSIDPAILTHIQGNHIHEVLLADLDFSTPVFVHTGFGTILWSGDSYLGVGDFAGMSAARESERLGLDPLTLKLSGLDANLLSEALNSGNHGDAVTLWGAYRNDDGSLVGDPYIVWHGTLDFMGVTRGDDNSIALTAQHHLSILDEKAGGKFSNEDQQRLFASDIGLEHAVDAEFVRLLWGQRVIGGNPENGPGDDLPGDNGGFIL